MNAEDIVNASKAYRNGAIIGTIAGIATGMFFNKSIWLFGIAGLVAGGFIGYKISNAGSPTLTIDPDFGVEPTL